VLSQDVFSPRIGHARVSPVVPTYANSQAIVLGDIRLCRLLLILPENPHKILARDIE
jgi:hypothetical protein